MKYTPLSFKPYVENFNAIALHPRALSLAQAQFTLAQSYTEERQNLSQLFSIMVSYDKIYSEVRLQSRNKVDQVRG